MASDRGISVLHRQVTVVLVCDDYIYTVANQPTNTPIITAWILMQTLSLSVLINKPRIPVRVWESISINSECLYDIENVPSTHTHILALSHAVL